MVVFELDLGAVEGPAVGFDDEAGPGEVDLDAVDVFVDVGRRERPSVMLRSNNRSSRTDRVAPWSETRALRRGWAMSRSRFG